MSTHGPVAELALFLTDLKRRSGRSFAALARRSQVGGSTLHRWCRGERVPWDFTGLDRYARACGASREELAELRRRWVRAEVATRLAAEQASGAASAPATVRPAQLPATPPSFAGRAAHLRDMDAMLAVGRERPRAMVTIAIVGMAGVGKSALAVHWAHRVRHRFPDGQLYVNLNGFDPDRPVRTPAGALHGFLAALGVPPHDVPAELDACAALYRSVLSDRRVLVVLDNARDVDQVRPLLPGAADCLVVVTCRNQLTGLVAAEGARVVGLDVLDAVEARAMLTRRLGTGRVRTDPPATEDIIELCGRLPLALTILAARAASRPTFPLAALAAELRDTHYCLDALHGGDPASDVRSVFSWSCQAVSEPAARLFRLIGLHAGPDFTAAAAASLSGTAVADARRLLAELVRAHLVIEPVPGRYTLHDLLRMYAAERVHTVDDGAQRHAATVRLLDHYLHTAYAGARLLDPHRHAMTPPAPAPGAIPEAMADAASATAWFTTERAVLLAIVVWAARHAFDRHVWQLAWALSDFLDRAGHWHEWLEIQRMAVEAARRLGDRSAEARALRGAANAMWRLCRYEDAMEYVRRALELFEALADDDGQGRCHLGLSALLDPLGRHTEALDHAQLAYDRYRTLGDRTGQANALNNIGWYQTRLGNRESALDFGRRALALMEEVGDAKGQALTWDSLAYAHLHLGQYAEAQRCARRAVDLFHDIGDRYMQAQVLGRLGDTHDAAGNHDAAEDSWQEALAILEALRHPTAADLRGRLR